MVRGNKVAKWVKSKWRPNVDYLQTNEKKSFRQKVNLVQFVNTFAEKFNLPGWELEPNEGFSGGKVIITSKYTYDLHEEQYKLCKKSGNKAYEMIFIVSNALISSGIEEIFYKPNGSEERIAKTIKTSSCRLVEEFPQIDFWDGINKGLRIPRQN